MSHGTTRALARAAALLVTTALSTLAVAAPDRAKTKASDGTSVGLVVYAPDSGTEGKAAIVAMSDMGRGAEDWAPLAERVTACGITLIAVDHRMSDGSKISITGIGEQMETLGLDATAAVEYARRELGAVPDRIAFVADGQGASACVDAAREDTQIRALYRVGGRPSLVNLVLYDKKWDDRPMGFVINDADDKKAVKSALKMIKKEDFAEAMVITAAEKSRGAHIIAGVDGVADRVVGRLHAWLNRPEYDGVPDEPPGADAAPTAHTAAPAAGAGVRVSGYLVAAAGGRLTAVEVRAHPDPTSNALDERSRRIVLKPKSGKHPTVAAEFFAWDGKRWKSRRKAVISGAGGFTGGSERRDYEVWLSAHDLDVPPFAKAAITCTGLAGKTALWNGVPAKEGQPAPQPSGLEPGNPSTWTIIDLQ